jgi:hypothetical protein
MVEYIPCYSAPAVRWGLLPPSRLASRKILMSKISKGGQGQHSMYLASWSRAMGQKESCKMTHEDGRRGLVDDQVQVCP